MFTRDLNPIILCYHQISEGRLRSHVRFLKQYFDIVPLPELLAETFEREGRSATRMLALTMDDCYAYDFANARTVCESEQVHCTFFLPVQYALEGKNFWPQRLKNLFDVFANSFWDEKGSRIALNNNKEKHQWLRKYYANYNQNDVQTDAIERMVDKLYEINRIEEEKTNPILSIRAAKAAIGDFVAFESHSMTHPKLYLCNPEIVAEELFVSKKTIAQTLSNDSRCFCYPYGSDRHIGESWQQLSKHYDYGFTLKRGGLTQRSNPSLLPRIDLYERDSLLRVATKIMLNALR